MKISKQDRQRLEELKRRSKKENSLQYTLNSLVNNLVGGMATTIIILMITIIAYYLFHGKFIIQINEKKLFIAPIMKPTLFWSISVGILYTATTTLLSSADEETAIALFFFKLGKESQQFKINTLSTQLIQKESKVKYKFDDSNLIQETLLDSIRMYDALTEGQNISRDSYGRAKGLGDARWKRAKELLVIIQAISKNSELIDTNRDRVINNLKKQIAFQRTSI